MASKKQVQYFIKETIEKPVTQREFLKFQKEQILAEMIPQSQVIKSKIFTRSKLNELVRDKLLTPTEYKSKIYFRHEDILNILKKPTKQSKLF